jgi:RNA polymerase sigma-70 factor, ECF subfamily
VIREPGAGHKAFVMSDALATAFLPEPKDAGLAGADQRRFHEMVTGQLDFIWRCLRRMGIPAGDVDDAAQQVFLVASSKLSSIAPGSERSFLFATASRIAANARRAVHRRDEAHRHLAHHDPEHTPSPEELTDQLRARALMDRVLVDMPEELREAFVLFELEELSVSEVAEILAVPIGTVGSRLRRAREDFQERVHRRKASAEFRKGGA